MGSLNLPAKMDFTMGSTEQKMDMTLDDIIKQNRKTKPRVPIKSQNRVGNTPFQRTANATAARAALQRTVAARSSKLRQGKFAEARARNGAGKFAATQAAGKRAFTSPVLLRNKAWMKSSDVRRNNFNRQRSGSGQKLNPYSAAAGNMKISVINDGSKLGGQRFLTAPFRRRNVPNIPARQVQAGQPKTDRMDVEYGQPQVQKSKARTLDSLFAEIKERRNTQPLVVQPFSAIDQGIRRGGRGGFSGRRRQAGQ